MRYRKTPGKERDTYKLYDDFGELLCEIKAGDYGVTADDIKSFHAVDPQLKTYALGALEQYDFLYDIQNVRLVIFQPRRDNVSKWELPKAELLKWAEETLKPVAQLAYEGQGEWQIW